MPLILKNRHDRFAFQFGCRSGLRSTDEVVDQLQEQLGRERAQHAFDLAEKENEIAITPARASPGAPRTRAVRKPSRSRRVQVQACIEYQDQRELALESTGGTILEPPVLLP